MNNIWNELSEESKQLIKQEYEGLQGPAYKERIYELELIFGKDNLDSKSQIKIWEDVEKHFPDIADNFNQMFQNLWKDDANIYDLKVYRKVVATIKISKLIEFGYGGMITDEEWADQTKEKYVIVCYDGKIDSVGMTYNNLRDFIAFHTEKQRNEFFKNNEQLCKDYYML